MRFLTRRKGRAEQIGGIDVMFHVAAGIHQIRADPGGKLPLTIFAPVRPPGHGVQFCRGELVKFPRQQTEQPVGCRFCQREKVG